MSNYFKNNIAFARYLLYGKEEKANIGQLYTHLSLTRHLETGKEKQPLSY